MNDYIYLLWKLLTWCQENWIRTMNQNETTDDNDLKHVTQTRTKLLQNAHLHQITLSVNMYTYMYHIDTSMPKQLHIYIYMTHINAKKETHAARNSNLILPL